MKNILIFSISLFIFSCDDDSNPMGPITLCDESIEVELWGECYNIEETTSLDLSGNSSNGWDGGLNGEIPQETGNLINLTYLSLVNNQLTGEIPSTIWDLNNLTTLKLSGNFLSGPIPMEIGNLSNIIFWGLSLSTNKLCNVVTP